MPDREPGWLYNPVWMRLLTEVVQVEIKRFLARSPLVGRYLPGDYVRGPIPGTSVPYGAAGYPQAVGATESDGTSDTVARADHVHALGIMTTLGDLLYGAASGVATRLAGNTTTTRKFLRQTGDGGASAAPAWDTLQAGDYPAMVGDSGAGGTRGAVPAPAAGDATKVLLGSGAWGDAPTVAHEHNTAGDGGALAGDEHDTFSDYAEQGSAPASPASGYVRLYTKADGLYYKLSDGTEVGPLGTGGGGGGGGAGDHDHVWQEDKSADCDGMETAFATANTFIENSTLVVLNGVVQTPGDDYTEDGDEGGITFTVAPETGDSLIIAYEIAATGLTVEEADGTPSVSNVTKIVVSNGTLTDDGGGQVTVSTGGGGTDTAAIHDNVAGEIAAITEKTTPVDDDMLLIEDSEDSDNKKMVKLSSLPTGGAGATAEVNAAARIYAYYTLR